MWDRRGVASGRLRVPRAPQRLTLRASRRAFFVPDRGLPRLVLTGNLLHWHEVCVDKTTMLNTHLPSREIGFESTPEFASDAEIALAERLRLRLEERYFGRTATPMPLLVWPDKDH